MGSSSTFAGNRSRILYLSIPVVLFLAIYYCQGIETPENHVNITSKLQGNQIVDNLGKNTSQGQSKGRGQRKRHDHEHSKRVYSFFNTTTCSVDHSSLVQEVRSYKSIVSEIVHEAMHGSYKGRAYSQLADFVDTYDSRLTGSDGLEDAIDYLKDRMVEYGFYNVHTEDVPNVPGWKRGLESAQLLTPRPKKLSILGLGMSASTPSSGIKAAAIVFNSYREMLRNRILADGKIVICNYGGPAMNVLDTEDNGYAQIANSGASAVLYRSAAPFSIYSAHARRANLYYDSSAPEIPIAYLTVEDADFLSRVQARGSKLSIYLNMQNTNETRTSRNLFGDLPGSEKADEFVILSAHSDSWDVGQGAQDDGVGIYSTMEGLSLLKYLNLIPRRTIRAVMWTAEEYGLLGSAKYIQDQGQRLNSQLSVAMEADYGCLKAMGLIFNGKSALGCILHEILQLLQEVNVGLLVQAHTYRSDLDNFQEAGFPVVSLNGDDGRYFWFHHTEADTMTAVNSTVLDTCMATWAATAFILADLKEMIPRGFDPL